MSEMVERVARALYLQSGMTYSNSQFWQDMARAAIEAMREPTEEMLKAERIGSYDNMTGAWQAMIDAALGRGGV